MAPRRVVIARCEAGRISPKVHAEDAFQLDSFARIGQVGERERKFEVRKVRLAILVRVDVDYFERFVHIGDCIGEGS
jgi:hypothetical protein